MLNWVSTSFQSCTRRMCGWSGLHEGQDWRLIDHSEMFRCCMPCHYQTKYKHQVGLWRARRWWVLTVKHISTCLSHHKKTSEWHSRQFQTLSDCSGTLALWNGCENWYISTLCCIHILAQNSGTTLNNDIGVPIIHGNDRQRLTHLVFWPRGITSASHTIAHQSLPRHSPWHTVDYRRSTLTHQSLCTQVRGVRFSNVVLLQIQL